MYFLSLNFRYLNEIKARDFFKFSRLYKIPVLFGIWVHFHRRSVDRNFCVSLKVTKLGGTGGNRRYDVIGRIQSSSGRRRGSPVGNVLLLIGGPGQQTVLGGQKASGVGLCYHVIEGSVVAAG